MVIKVTEIAYLDDEPLIDPCRQCLPRDRRSSWLHLDSRQNVNDDAHEGI